MEHRGPPGVSLQLEGPGPAALELAAAVDAGPLAGAQRRGEVLLLALGRGGAPGDGGRSERLPLGAVLVGEFQHPAVVVVLAGVEDVARLVQEGEPVNAVGLAGDVVAVEGAGRGERPGAPCNART